MISFSRAAAALGTWLLVSASSASVFAQELSAPAAAPDQSVFVMGGPFTPSNFGETFSIWDNQYEDNFFVGIGYQHFLYSYGSFRLGVEAGIGLRAGENSSAEVWGGTVAQLTNFDIGALNVTPSIIFGLSAVTDYVGVEADRVAALGHPAPVLFYFTPEIAISSDNNPEWEAFVRIQHRSGGFGTIAEIDASNAPVVGFRYRF